MDYAPLVEELKKLGCDVMKVYDPVDFSLHVYVVGPAGGHVVDAYGCVEWNQDVIEEHFKRYGVSYLHRFFDDIAARVRDALGRP